MKYCMQYYVNCEIRSHIINIRNKENVQLTETLAHTFTLGTEKPLRGLLLSGSVLLINSEIKEPVASEFDSR